AGSAGVDLETAIEKTLVTSDVQLIDLMVYGPLGQGLDALLIGQSSAALKRLIIIPGLIDLDYTGVIKIMCYTLHPPVNIPKGCKIAQLIPLQTEAGSPNRPLRGDRGFGSTAPMQVLLTQQLLSEKPLQTVVLQQGSKHTTVHFTIDTGADVTIIN
ncbi:POK9 protein, partial [Malurus elegans]|nr:POK9 protein [Malurus elegans]